MKPFDYIVVLVAILIGLAIGDVVISTHRLMRGARRVRWHWAAPAGGVLALLAILRQFWVFWHRRELSGGVTLVGFLPMVVLLIVLFLAAAAALPDEVPAEGIDLKAFYLGNRAHFWGLTLAWFLGVVAYNVTAALLLGVKLQPLLEAVNAITTAILISLLVARRLWWHAVAIALLLGGIVWQWLQLSIG